MLKGATKQPLLGFKHSNTIPLEVAGWTLMVWNMAFPFKEVPFLGTFFTCFFWRSTFLFFLMPWNFPWYHPQLVHFGRLHQHDEELTFEVLIITEGIFACGMAWILQLYGWWFQFGFANLRSLWYNLIVICNYSGRTIWWFLIVVYVTSILGGNDPVWLSWN